ncbi:MAG: sialidase family protein [Opitutaceae bacterium]
MLRRLSALFLLLAVAHAAPEIRQEEISSPAPATALGGSLASAPDGTLWLSWLEPLNTPAGATALRFAKLAPTAKSWSPAQTIASGAGLYAGTSDFPALAVGAAGHATAIWFVNNPPSPATAHLHHGAGYRTLVSQTADNGKTWSTPEPLSRESDMVEFVSLVALADGRVLAAWLDGRAKKAAPAPAHGAAHSSGPAQRLYARVVGSSGPDTLVDPSVCDCCQTALTAFPDGTALLAYRGRTADEVRDIQFARWRGTAWDEPRAINRDAWKINGCPVNGPQLASEGGRVAAVWFTAEGGTPRVLAASSPDAGARFLLPLRIDGGQPAGRVDTLMLRDGAMLVSWVETDGNLWLRRVSPDLTLSEPVALTKSNEGRVKGFPRMALRRDYAGGDTKAELVVTFTTEGAAAALHTLLVSVPEGDFVESEKACDCALPAEQLQGDPIRGTIAEVLPAAGTVRVRHFEVPGIFAAGTREFKVPPPMLAVLPATGQFIGRVERRESEWWLFDVRVIPGPSRSP